MMVDERLFTNDLTQEGIVQEINTRLSKTKWAIGQSDPEITISEMPTTVDTFSEGRSFAPIRRQNIQRPVEGVVTLDRKRCLLIRRRFQELSSAEKRFPDLKDILWMFDRATLAAASRDALLEATIGLERLLVNGPGENTRRFRVYGTALLSNSQLTEVESNLKKIYDMRSGVAHGTSGKSSDIEKFALHARTAKHYFAEIIRNVTILVNAGKLHPNPRD